MATASVSPKGPGSEPTALFCPACGYDSQNPHYHGGSICRACQEDAPDWYAEYQAWIQSQEEELAKHEASLSDEEKAEWEPYPDVPF